MSGADGTAGSHQVAGIEYEWFSGFPAEALQRPSCVAIGMFDGVHRGHRALLSAARAHADEFGLQLVAVTFDAHPHSVVSPRDKVPLLQTPLDRYKRLLSTGVDAVMALSFSVALAAKTPAEFLDLLCPETQPRAVFVGEGFRFGAQRAGDCSLLKRQGAERGFDVTVVPPIELDERRISSTRIRSAVEGGAIEEATALLGAAHEFSVRVMAFHSVDQMAWFRFPAEIAQPPSGLYLGRIRRLPYIPVLVEIPGGGGPCRIRHLAQKPLDSLSSLYVLPVTIELLDTALFAPTPSVAT